MLTELQRNALVLLVDMLTKNHITFQATGGLAAIAHGAKRPLYDIDIDIYKKDVEKVRALFKDYITEDWNNELEGEEDEFDIWMMKLTIYGVPVDISQMEGGRVRAVGGAWTDLPETMETELLSIEGIELPVQSKARLIAYKTILGRDVDLEDIRQLS